MSAENICVLLVSIVEVAKEFSRAVGIGVATGEGLLPTLQF